MRPPIGWSAAMAMRYVVMSHDADARSEPASRAVAGSATTSIVEFSGTSAFPSAIEPMSFSEARVIATERAASARPTEHTRRVPRTYEVIVIGLGAHGSAAAYHLAKRGLRVLGIEQFVRGHTLGSSGGLSRITRLSYYEHPDYVPLLRRP